MSADVAHTRMHDHQMRVTLEIVRDLVDDQFPAWRSLPIAQVFSEGTVNAIFRVGDQLAARFPLQPVTSKPHGSGCVPKPRPPASCSAAPGSRARARRDRSAQSRLPAAVVGADVDPRHHTSQVDASTSAGFAHDLAEFIAHVRTIDVRGRTFAGTGRGGDLRAHDEWMQVCFQQK